MNLRFTELGPNDVIVKVNKTHLLKFIGWVEAHRPPGEWEPGFLGPCINAMNFASEGYALPATAECPACHKEHVVLSPDMLYDSEVGAWFCANDDECNQRRMDGAA